MPGIAGDQPAAEGSPARSVAYPLGHLTIAAGTAYVTEGLLGSVAGSAVLLAGAARGAVAVSVALDSCCSVKPNECEFTNTLFDYVRVWVRDRASGCLQACGEYPNMCDGGVNNVGR